jgi:hypothetical protein
LILEAVGGKGEKATKSGKNFLRKSGEKNMQKKSFVLKKKIVIK